MRLATILVLALALCGCAAQDCYTEDEIDAAYTHGYHVGRASLLRCPECPPCPGWYPRYMGGQLGDLFRQVREDARREFADEIDALTPTAEDTDAITPGGE